MIQTLEFGSCSDFCSLLKEHSPSTFYLLRLAGAART